MQRQFSLRAIFCVVTLACIAAALWRPGTASVWNGLCVVGTMLLAIGVFGYLLPRVCTRWLILGAVIGALPTLGLYVLEIAGVHREPILGRLLVPGDLITWLFILGDGGSELERVFYSVLTGTIFNATAGALAVCLLWAVARTILGKSLKSASMRPPLRY